MSQDPPQPAIRRRLSPFQISLTGMAVIVVCCAAVFWSWRRIRQEQHPALQWARALESHKAIERQEAARLLFQSDPGDFEIATVALIGALKDEDDDVRGEAARSLGVVISGMIRNGTSREAIDPAVMALAELLLAPRPEVRASEWVATKMPDQPEQSPIRRMIEYTGPDESEIQDAGSGGVTDPSWMAASALGEIAPKTPWAEVVVIALTKVLCTEGDGRRQRAAARALKRFGPDAQRAVAELRSRLRKAVAQKGGSQDWRWIAAEALARIAPGTDCASEAILALTEPFRSRADRETRGAAMKVLIRLGPAAHEAVPALIAIMKETGTPAESEVRYRWVPEALGKIAPGTPSADTAIAALAESLDTGPDGLRDSALQALSRFGPAAKSAIPRIEALSKLKNYSSFADQVLRAIDPGR